ncbi:MAG: hypothetical protein I8H74_02315 [Moraxellaceae bacterium]|nr:hypothetical protein [Moraxellaceae bacterium]
MANDPLIILGEQNLSQKISEFYEKLDVDSQKLQEFVENPIGSIMSEVFPDTIENITSAKISESNKFLFIALKNDKFVNWATTYQDDLEKKIALPENQGRSIYDLIPRAEFISDLSKALIESGDQELIAKIISNVDISLPNARTVTVSDDIAIVTALAVAIVVVLTAIDITPKVPNPAEDLTIKPALLNSIVENLINQSKKL